MYKFANYELFNRKYLNLTGHVFIKVLSMKQVHYLQMFLLNLLNCCLLLLPLWTLWKSVLVLCFVVRYLCPFLFCNHLDGEERVGCFA